MYLSAAMSTLMRSCLDGPPAGLEGEILAVKTVAAAAGRIDPAGATIDVMSAAAAMRRALFLPVPLTSSSWYLGLTPSRWGRAAVGGAGSPVPRRWANPDQSRVCPKSGQPSIPVVIPRI